MEMNISNRFAVSLALSFGDKSVNCESICLYLIRYVKASYDVLDITHVSVVMVMFVRMFFVIVIMMVIMLMFVSVLVLLMVMVMLVMVVMCLMFMDMFMVVIVLMRMFVIVMIMHVFIFFDTVDRYMRVGAFDAALDALFEFIRDIGNAQ